MKRVLDTNAYCYCDMGNKEALSLLETAHSIYLPTIVYGELYYGFKHGSRLKDNLKRLDSFIQEFDVELIPIDLKVAKLFGDVFSFLRKKGRPIPTNDIWIAASTLAISGAVLITEDQHFQEIDFLEVERIQK
ncbi:MAG: type II toxin-antitoxin system VapC family toxin [Deltaproteobacteria bacterium]|nr:type II toxin-antitoxin system VapC family toxin [Deltaproteobacteria bacterium]